jgi:hypothetical protein
MDSSNQKKKKKVEIIGTTVGTYRHLIASDISVPWKTRPFDENENEGGS